MIMLAVKMLAGAAKDVNLRNPLHTGDEACNASEVHPGLKTQNRCHQFGPQKGLISPKNLKNKIKVTKLEFINKINSPT